MWFGDANKFFDGENQVVIKINFLVMELSLVPRAFGGEIFWWGQS
jgi:hypothetical protein